MRSAEKIWDLHVVTRRDITNIASIIDSEFKELREAAGRVLDSHDQGLIGDAAFEQLRSAIQGAKGG